MRLLVTAFVLSLLIAPIAAMAQSPATIQVAAGSSSTVTLPPRIDPTAVQVLFRGAPATGVSAKLGRDGVDRTLEVTADRRARAGAGYAIRLTSGTSKVPTDIPLEILTSGRTSELALLPAPASTETLAAPSFTPLRLTTAALKFTGQRPPPFEPKALTTAALKFTGQRPPPFEPKSITTPALRFTGTRP